MASWGLGRWGRLLAEPPIAGAVWVDDLPFEGESRASLGELRGVGLDARRLFDLATLRRDQLAAASGEFFVRTGVPDGLRLESDWRLAVDGLVQRPLSLSIDQLGGLAVDQGERLIECAGNTRFTRFGLIGSARWQGVAVADLLDRAGPSTAARALRASGFDVHSRTSTNSAAGCSWVFTLDQLRSAGAFIALRMNDQPLPAEHGWPLRLVVPGWYGCCSVKWLQRLELVAGDSPSTGHMREFASRTHQEGVPQRALDFRPARIDPAALPIRVERWRVGENWLYRVVGIAWGGPPPSGTLKIRFAPQDRLVSLDQPPPSWTASGWSLWSHLWRPPAAGRYLIDLAFSPAPPRAPRMAMGHYLRGVVVAEV